MLNSLGTARSRQALSGHFATNLKTHLRLWVDDVWTVVVVLVVMVAVITVVLVIAVMLAVAVMPVITAMLVVAVVVVSSAVVVSQTCTRGTVRSNGST